MKFIFIENFYRSILENFYRSVTGNISNLINCKTIPALVARAYKFDVASVVLIQFFCYRSFYFKFSLMWENSHFYFIYIFSVLEGRLCVWSQSDADPQFSVVNYRSSETEVIEQPLVLNCEPGEPGKLIWTPTAATPNEVYYQVFFFPCYFFLSTLIF